MSYDVHGMREPASRYSSRRLGIAVAVSLSLHLGVFWSIAWLPDETHRPLRARYEMPVRLVVMPPREALPPTEPPEPAPPVSARQRAVPPRAAPDVRRTDGGRDAIANSEVEDAAANNESSASSADASATTSPRRSRSVDLFAPGALEKAAQGEAALSHAELGQRRLDTWAEDFAAHQRAQTEGARGVAKELERRMADWFLPEVETLERASMLGLGVASSLVPAINDMAMFGAQPHAPDALGRLDPRASHGRRDALGKCLLGDCYESGHVVASLFVVIQIDHEEDGSPVDWRVVESSGFAAFDSEALDAVDTAVRQVARSAFSEPPLPTWSRWEFLVEANRYLPHSLALDPTFIPPGKELEKETGILGKTTLVRRVRLVAIHYRARSATDAAVRPSVRTKRNEDL